MAGSISESESRLSIQAVRAMDEWSNQFRRRLRQCTIELASARKAAVTPAFVREAVAMACNAMTKLDDDENDERRPRVA